MVEQRPYNLVICDLQMPGEKKEEKNMFVCYCYTDCL